MTKAACLAASLRLLVLFFTNFLPVALSRQRLFHALFFAGFEIERMPLYFLDDVFLLDFAFEAAEGIFQGLSLLHSNFRQYLHPQTFPVWIE